MNATSFGKQFASFESYFAGIKEARKEVTSISYAKKVILDNWAKGFGKALAVCGIEEKAQFEALFTEIIKGKGLAEEMFAEEIKGKNKGKRMVCRYVNVTMKDEEGNTIFDEKGEKVKAFMPRIIRTWSAFILAEVIFQNYISIAENIEKAEAESAEIMKEREAEKARKEAEKAEEKARKEAEKEEKKAEKEAEKARKAEEKARKEAEKAEARARKAEEKARKEREKAEEARKKARKARTKKSPYTILNVEEGASWTKIKAAYREAIKANHPDRGGDEEKAKEIVGAYEELKKEYGKAA